MEKKTLLITGASGFIGRNLNEFFHHRKFEIFSPTHKELDLLSQRSVDTFFNENAVDYVIHCANVGGNRKFSGIGIVEKNVRMFCNLTKNSEKFGTMVHLGSGAEYDKSQNLVKVEETDFGKSIPKDEYGFSKYLMSTISDTYENVVCLRLFGVFGKYEDYEYKFISNAIVKNLYGLPITIRQNVYFDWLYIDDLMNVIYYFVKNTSRFGAYNVTPVESQDLVTIAKIINLYSESPSKIVIETPGLNLSYTGRNERLQNEVKNVFTPPSVAIKRLFEYYKSILPSIDRNVIEKDVYSKFCNVITETGGN